MSALPALANFAFPLLIVVIQLVTNDHLRTQIRKELHVALDGWRIHSRHISNSARFPAMSSDNSKSLHFSPFPEDQLEWGPWFHQHIQNANEYTFRIKNSDSKYETISYLSMYIMGYRWTDQEDIWAADQADISKLTADEIIKYTPSATAEEKQFLKDDEKLFHFVDARLHRQMQVTLRAAIMDAVRGHALFPEIEIFQKTIGPLDLYQGSRLLSKLTELCTLHLRRAKKSLLPAALQLPSEIQANNDISKVEMHEYVSRLEKFVLALTLGGDKDAESDLLENFYEILRDHQRPIITNIVKEAGTKGKTIKALRDVVLEYMPLDTTRSDVANLASAAPPPEPSLIERTCTAMMSFLSTAPKSTEPGGSSRGKTYTTEQQNAYIERLKAQSKAKDQTIKTLKHALTSDSIRGGRGGRGTSGGGRGASFSGGGRGRGRGRVQFADEGPPEADLLEGPGEIFCASMDAAIQSDLAFEQDVEQAAVDKAKLHARADPPTDNALPADEAETSDDESPAASEPFDPPVHEPPVYSNPEGPPPPRADWMRLFVGLLFIFIGTACVFGFQVSDQCSTVQELFPSLHPGFWGSLPVFLEFHVDGSTSTLYTLSWHFRLLWWDIVEPMLTHLISKFLVGRLSL